MFEHSLDSLVNGALIFVRVLAGAFLLALIGVWASIVPRNGYKCLIVASATIVFMSGTYFHLTHKCVSGSTDADDSGRPVFVCDQWVSTEAPYLIEETMAIGAVSLLGIAAVMLYMSGEETNRRVTALEARLTEHNGTSASDETTRDLE